VSGGAVSGSACLTATGDAASQTMTITQYLYDDQSGHVCRKIENPVAPM